MGNSWNWVGRYVAVIVVTLVLAAALGSMDLFEKTSVFSGRLTASHLVRFLGYATALTAFWLLGSARDHRPAPAARALVVPAASDPSGGEPDLCGLRLYGLAAVAQAVHGRLVA